MFKMKVMNLPHFSYYGKDVQPRKGFTRDGPVPIARRLVRSLPTAHG